MFIAIFVDFLIEYDEDYFWYSKMILKLFILYVYIWIARILLSILNVLPDIWFFFWTYWVLQQNLLVESRVMLTRVRILFVSLFWLLNFQISFQHGHSSLQIFYWIGNWCSRQYCFNFWWSSPIQIKTKIKKTRNRFTKLLW